MRKKNRQSSLKPEEGPRLPLNSPFKKKIFESNFLKKVSAPKKQRTKTENAGGVCAVRESFAGQPSLSSFKARRSEKENSRLRENHTDASLEPDKFRRRGARGAFSEKLKLLKKEKLLFFNNLAKAELEEPRKQHHRSASNKVQKLKMLFKDSRRKTCNDHYLSFVQGSRGRNRQSSERPRLLESIHEKSKLKPGRNQLSTVNESSVANNPVLQRNKEPCRAAPGMAKLSQAVEAGKLCRRPIEAARKTNSFIPRKSFHKKTKDFSRKSRATFDRGFHKIKELSGISFFNANQKARGWDWARCIRKTQFKRRADDAEGLNQTLQKSPVNARNTIMFPKIQHESNYSFVKSVYHKWARRLTQGRGRASGSPTSRPTTKAR